MNNLISADVAAKLIASAPSSELRVIIALSRYAGLRCPSEVSKLCWSDVLWDEDKLRVTSIKTSRHGKGSRIVPLFPAVRAELERLRSEVDAVGNALVVRIDGSLRSQIVSILDTVGYADLRQPFSSFRAAAREDLAETGEYTDDELNEWFGHSPVATIEGRY